MICQENKIDPKIQSYFDSLISKGQFPQSFLFVGPQGAGKLASAKYFALKLLESGHPLAKDKLEKDLHPDFTILSPEGKVGMHSIESIRELIHEECLKPHEANWRVFTITYADRMQPAAANALLKTLEDPSPSSIIILLTDHKEHILPTIRSRCHLVHVLQNPSKTYEQNLVEYGLSQSEANRIFFFAEKSHTRALQLAEEKWQSLLQTTYRLLADMHIASILDSFALIQKVSEEIENLFQAQIEDFQQKTLKQFSDISAKELSELKKQHLGLASSQKFQDVRIILLVILQWFHDLHLLEHGYPIDKLIYSDYETNLREQKAWANSYIQVKQVLEEAEIMISRQSKLQTCLENAWIKILNAIPC